MAFYDIDTFDEGDYPRKDKGKIKSLVKTMNEYARLSFKTDNIKETYDKLKEVTEFVVKNEEMIEPYLNMFDRLQTITKFSSPVMIDEMLHAMGDIGETYPKHASECKIRVVKYTKNFFENAGAEHPNAEILMSTRQQIRDKLNVVSLSDNAEVAVSKPNRFLRLAGLRAGKKNGA